MEHYNEAGWVNIGTGTDVSIKNLAEMVVEVVVLKVRLNGTSPNQTEHRANSSMSAMRNIGWSSSIGYLTESILFKIIPTRAVEA